ncbi:hypothetical protein QAD02_001824 [Eretmocerus hayati]|uniref:Uncharacterized protein n=1 Tax=Eretmocerus hayati TaxID=131215 RepID=A0ACC2NHD4_9HYME|nr:hypothetical protein QAD02_001824 [Eretmocerus hayati]
MLSFTKLLYKQYLLTAFFATIGIFLYCEFFIYYVVLIQCRWPNLDVNNVDNKIHPPTPEETPVHAMFLADTHLLGPKRGHWFDKLRREWQMYRAFQTAITIHKPDVVFILGDVFDEGQWSSSSEFQNYISRFKSIFFVPESTYRYVVAGNHDIGFHYAISPFLSQRFVEEMKAPNIRRITIRGNHFILMNSMAFEGDGCFLCKPAELAVNNISRQLKCAKGIGNDCHQSNSIKRFSRPILLQHFPLYRESDEICNELDEAPLAMKDIKFRERWECLSKEASDQLLHSLHPRLVVDGHTHHGCSKIHQEDILEITVPSFSWRNKDNPSYLLGIFTPHNYAVSKCFMPTESTVISTYVVSGIGIIICVTFRIWKITVPLRPRKVI